jgi:diacylglycerol kinase (ATP)
VSSPPNHSSDIPDLILANPTAGGGFSGETVPLLQELIAGRHWRAEVRTAGSVKEFAAIASAAATDGRRRILALGGDGTFQLLLNAVAKTSQACLGILPAGGGNDLASALNLPNDPLRAAELLFSRGEERCLDAAQARTSDGRERLYMGGAGVGLDAEAMHYAGGVYRHWRGRGRYLMSAIRALGSFRGVESRVSLTSRDGKISEVHTKALVVAVLNTPSYGAGVRLAPQARLDDGILNLSILEELSPLEILRVLPRLAIKGELETKRLHRYEVTQIRIETERPCALQADGEIIGQTPVEIRVVPQAIRVWCPPRPASGA